MIAQALRGQTLQVAIMDLQVLEPTHVLRGSVARREQERRLDTPANRSYFVPHGPPEGPTL